jgi:hypothetical protein
MADAGLFIGYGSPARGREAKAVAVFNEAMQYWAQLQQSGKIESFEVAIVEPHGGDLGGFALLRGSADQLAQLRVDKDFQRISTRAQLIVENLGVVGVTLGQGLVDQMAVYGQQVSELA